MVFAQHERTNERSGIMGRYAERNLYEGEYVVEKAPRDVWGLVGYWTLGILFCWLLFIPTIIAIKETIIFTHTEIVLTNRRLICKQGVFHTKSKDVPLLKIQGVYVDIGFWGRIFNVGTIYIDTEYGTIKWKIQDADEFKTTIVGAIDQFERERLSSQSMWTAQALLDGFRAMNPHPAGRVSGRVPQNRRKPNSIGTTDPYAGYERRY